jgi:hypothetical protein
MVTSYIRPLETNHFKVSSTLKLRKNLPNFYIKIPSSPLYQKRIRGDFHASLWQQFMRVYVYTIFRRSSTTSGFRFANNGDLPVKYTEKRGKWPFPNFYTWANGICRLFFIAGNTL